MAQLLKYEVNRLSQEELSYELEIRGATGTGTVDQMRKTLRGKQYLLDFIFQHAKNEKSPYL